jgi:hypothetical protein
MNMTEGDKTYTSRFISETPVKDKDLGISTERVSLTSLANDFLRAALLEPIG